MTDDLDALVRELFAGSDPVKEWLTARAAAEQAPPPEPMIIPPPEFFGDRGRMFSTVARYACTVPGGGCPWGYVVDTSVQVPLRVILPGSGEDISQALTEQAEERARAVQERIEGAFREHFTLFHPGQEPPDQLERLREEETARRRRREAASR
jgi:hypothetical protein